MRPVDRLFRRRDSHPKYGSDLLGDSTNLPVFKKFMNTVLAGTERENSRPERSHVQEQ